MSTALSCRQYETRMYVAMMADAFASFTKSYDFAPCKTGNTLTRYFELCRNDTPQYTKMWGFIESKHGEWGWNDMADYQIDRNWEHARRNGMKIGGVPIPAQYFVNAQIRWETNNWLCYEYKRSKRRAAFAPFLRVAAIV